MNEIPKSMRFTIGIFGRTNAGKSSFFNMVVGQDVSIVADLAGTTTDVVEKAMEFLPLGPVTLIDTAGLGDKTELAQKREQKTAKIFSRVDLAVVVVEPDIWGEDEDFLLENLKSFEIPIITAVGKLDLKKSSSKFLEKVAEKTDAVCEFSALEKKGVEDFRKCVFDVVSPEYFNKILIAGDLVEPGGVAMLIVPIDQQAPKGRLILPQVQTIRDLLDNSASAFVVKESEYSHYLNVLKSEHKPSLVVCDSQVVFKMVAETPSNIRCTTFSILFARLKGDLTEYAKGAATIDTLLAGDRILISESCSHHSTEDDIGRVKIPNWIRQYVGEKNIDFDVVSGRDYPESVKDYKLIIHCGSCMLTRKEVVNKILDAKRNGVAVTNYGIAISKVQGVLERVLSPFPQALVGYKQAVSKNSGEN